MIIYESDDNTDENEYKDRRKNGHRPCSNCPPPCPEPSPCPEPLPYPDGGNRQKQCQGQGDQFQAQGDLTETQGDQAAAQGSQTQTQGDLAETQGDQVAAQGSQTQTQGDLAETQGDQAAAQGSQTQAQGDLAETQGDQAAAQGSQTQTQGDLAETQGDQAAAQSAQIQTQGDLAETQGDLAAAQGSQAQTQGDLSESLGDMTQSQEGETQGSQTQGDQTQSITGHGGQTQGDQTQSMSGHGDQTQGDQTLSSNPTISTPVSVSGVNVNVTVTCGECEKKKEECCCNCQEECRKSVTALLYLVKTLASTLTDTTASLISFYSLGLQESPTVGNIGSVTDCLFAILPESAGNEITVSTNALEALSFESVTITPNLFSLLLNYLGSLPINIYHPDDGKDCCTSVCDCCYASILQQLQNFYFIKTLLRINLAENSFTGYIYKISNGVVFLVDDLTSPTILYAIPICKILNYQPQ